MAGWFGRNRDRLLVGVALLGLAAGSSFWVMAKPEVAGVLWAAATLPVLLSLLFEIVTSLRRGDVGLDVVAALSMLAALAFGEPLAANVVALMYAGGQLLEAFAAGRARVEMTALLGRVARTAMRKRGDALEEVPITELAAGDRLLIREGEVLPVDGVVARSAALLDLSALTGESVPEPAVIGGEVLSGATSIGPAFELIASRPASESTYAAIVRLVEAAQSSRSPMVRMADRYAVGFLVLTLAIAGAAWLFAGDPVRALAVLVTATPCPLILAVPVAIISGLSRTAKIGVLVKNGGVLETLARVKTAIFDKTGTLTHGQAAVAEIRTMQSHDQNEVLRLAASLDQGSTHIVAAALIGEAALRGLRLSAPSELDEEPGAGMEGRVEGHRVVLGSSRYVKERTGRQPSGTLVDGGSDPRQSVTVAIDGEIVGLIVLADTVRQDASSALRELRDAGIEKLILASGDRADIANAVGAQLAVDESHGELTASAKVAIVQRESRACAVMMIGDGVNDAPALAAANVGVALAARGEAASSEAAGVVILIDALAPLAAAVRIARRTRRIALQSVFVGLGLSLGAMIAAALGYLPPVQGALVQEVIDVAVILNALRALR